MPHEISLVLLRFAAIALSAAGKRQQSFPKEIYNCKLMFGNVNNAE